MRQAVKSFLEKLLGHENLSSIVLWATKFFLEEYENPSFPTPTYVHGFHYAWKVLEFEKSPGKYWKSSANFLRSNSLKERFLSKRQHFSGFLCMLNLAVQWLTAMIFIWGVLHATMSIYSQHITGWRYSNLQLRA